jgi:hypothetical protein
VRYGRKKDGFGVAEVGEDVLKIGCEVMRRSERVSCLALSMNESQFCDQTRSDDELSI